MIHEFVPHEEVLPLNTIEKKFSDLADRVGAESLVYDPAGLGDAGVDGLTPGVVVRPATAQEAAEVLGYADERGLKVAIRGGGTRAGLGNPIAGLDLVLSTERLNGIFEYSAPDLMIGVQAGAKLADVQAHLEQHGQFLPVESPALGRGATVGGAIATNSSGPLRLSYGPARDWLIGVKFVLADGTSAKGGGRVVKNVAGYDMMKLFIGSLGTLGLIHEMNFKLMPLPTAQFSLIIAFESLTTACQTALKLIDTGTFPTALTVLDRRGAAALGLPMYESTLVVQVRNTRLAAERQVRDIVRLGQEAGGKPEDAGDLTAQKLLWGSISDFGYREEADERSLTLKVSTLPDQSAAMLTQAQGLAALHKLEMEGLAHAGHGLSWLTARYQDEDGALGFVGELSAWVEGRGGAVAAERVPLSFKRRLADVWGGALSAGEINLMRSVKAKLDPKSTLNPGRFVARI